MTDLGRFTLLASGQPYYVKHPDKSQYTLRDLSLGLARACRFNGQFPLYEDDIYSVAQHSVLVDDIVNLIFGMPKARPYAILHDAPEGILGDIITPVKVFCPEFYVMEKALETDMIENFDLSISDSIRDIVHKADIMACCIEAEALTGLPSTDYGLPAAPMKIRDIYPDWKPWGVREARDRYEARFIELIGHF